MSTCTCGQPRDTRGLCGHCDTAIRSGHNKDTCVACLIRDSKCAVCRIPCGSPAAARHHETACRNAEERKERARR